MVGRGQRVDTTRADGPLLVARHSGGGAVLMDGGLLSLDVLLPAGDPLLTGDVGAVFGHVGAAWAAALTTLGVPAVRVHDGPSTAHRLGDERQRLLATVCYATLGRGEVLAGGRKLVGLAQRRRRPGALVQCGLLRRWRPGPLLAALGASPHDAEVAAHAVGLDDLVDPPPADGTVRAAVEAAMQAMGTQEPT